MTQGLNTTDGGSSCQSSKDEHFKTTFDVFQDPTIADYPCLYGAKGDEHKCCDHNTADKGGRYGCAGNIRQERDEPSKEVCEGNGNS